MPGQSTLLQPRPVVPWWLVLLQGIAGILLGLLLVTAPVISLIALIRLLGWFWLIKGLLSIVALFTGEAKGHRGWLLLSGILGVLAGLAVLDHPLLSAVWVPTVLTLVIAVDGILIGLGYLAAAFQGAGWGAGLLGVISTVLGAILLSAPLLGAAALPMLLGLWGLAGGLGSVIFAFQLRRMTPAPG